jgi:hypothetical protein
MQISVMIRRDRPARSFEMMNRASRPPMLCAMTCTGEAASSTPPVNASLICAASSSARRATLPSGRVLGVSTRASGNASRSRSATPLKY